MKHKKEDSINFRVSTETKLSLKAMAKKEKRTLSNYLEMVLEQLITKNKNEY